MAQAPDLEPGLSPDIPAYREIPTLQIAEGNARQLRAEIENADSMRLARDENGHTTLHLAAARMLDSVTDIVERYTASEAVVLLSEKTRVEGWTSLHISTIKNNSAIVEYILSKVHDGEQRQAFIDEVDQQLEWTSLQWGAALDNVEAVETMMSHMSVSHQQKVMTSGWTLIHATAQTDAVSTMKRLMNRVEMNDNEKWKILTCPTPSGKTALHIAVAEGNARAAIMLLDLAGPNKIKLDAREDLSGRRAADYTDKFSMLGKYMSLAVEFEEPVIHMAAKRNDQFLVSWILDQYSCPKQQVINLKNADESTVLHAAVEGNSPEVIKEIARVLDQDEFLNSLGELNKDDESVFHYSVIKNHPSTTHAILASVSNKQKRRQLLALENNAGEDAADLARKLKLKRMKEIIKYHLLILNSGLEAFFYRFEYSLFSIDIPADCLKARYKRLEPREAVGDIGIVRNANFDATTCILYGDTNNVDKLIAAAVHVDDLNIHTWCNRGVLYLKQDRIEEAELAAFRVLELMSSDSVFNQLLPRINFAYYSAEVIRTEQAWDDCCEIMEGCEEHAGRDPVLQQFLSYCFLKILVRHLKEFRNIDNIDSTWYHEKLDKAVEQMIVLYKSGNDEYLADMWVWLLELQCVKNSQPFLYNHLESFRRETGIIEVDIKYCHQKAKEHDEKQKKDKKRQARMAKNCLSIAQDCTEKAEARKWYEEAVNLSEKWITENYWTLLCASTSSQGRLAIWAMEFYDKQSALVKGQHKQTFGRELMSEKDGWYFLTENFHGTNVPNSDNLQKVKAHLERITDREDGWITHGVKYARVKCLLGESQASIEDTFKKAIDACEVEIRKARALEHFGCYYMMIGDTLQARYYLQLSQVVAGSSPKKYTAWKAKNLLRIIDGGNVRRRQRF